LCGMRGDVGGFLCIDLQSMSSLCFGEPECSQAFSKLDTSFFWHGMFWYAGWSLLQVEQECSLGQFGLEHPFPSVLQLLQICFKPTCG
jgi:hypothetical protein